jgi:hypothetical protein
MSDRPKTPEQLQTTKQTNRHITDFVRHQAELTNTASSSDAKSPDFQQILNNLNETNTNYIRRTTSQISAYMEVDRDEVINACEKIELFRDFRMSETTHRAFRDRHGIVTREDALESTKVLIRVFENAQDITSDNSCTPALNYIRSILRLQPALTSDNTKGKERKNSDITDNIDKRYQWGDQTKPGAYLSYKEDSSIQIFVPRDRGSRYDIKGSLAVIHTIDEKTTIDSIRTSLNKSKDSFGNWKIDKIVENTAKVQDIDERYQWGDQTKPGAYLSYKKDPSIQILIPHGRGDHYDIKGAAAVMDRIEGGTLNKSSLSFAVSKSQKTFGNWKIDKIV